MAKETKQQQIKIKKMKSYLHRVHFQHLNEFVSKFKVKVEENLRSIHASHEGFTLVFSRHVLLEPQALFDLEVVYHVECEFDEATQTFFKTNENILMDFIEKNKAKLLLAQNVLSNSSKLIAELTSFNNKNPLILPAVLQGHKKKEEVEQFKDIPSNIIS
ncbi:MAG: hypothetical protein ACVCEJ_10030 [Candidatus Izemoplasmataceae bacterium]